MSTSMPITALTVLGILITILGLFAAGNIWVAGVGLVAIAFAGILSVMGGRRQG